MNAEINSAACGGIRIVLIVIVHLRFLWLRCLLRQQPTNDKRETHDDGQADREPADHYQVALPKGEATHVIKLARSSRSMPAIISSRLMSRSRGAWIPRLT